MFLNIMALMEWLNDHIWPVEKAFLGPGFVRDGARLAIAEMLRGGTTFFNDLYFFPEVTAAAAVESGMRACIGLPVIDVPTAWATGEDECIKKGLAVSANWQNESLISTGFQNYHAIGVFVFICTYLNQAGRYLNL